AARLRGGLEGSILGGSRAGGACDGRSRARVGGSSLTPRPESNCGGAYVGLLAFPLVRQIGLELGDTSGRYGQRVAVKDPSTLILDPVLTVASLSLTMTAWLSIDSISSVPPPKSLVPKPHPSGPLSPENWSFALSSGAVS